jgi:hypothetical protein
MKRGITILAIVVLCGAGMVFFNARKSSLKEAQAAESRGEYRQAMNLYAAEVDAAAPSHALPDRNHAKIRTTAQWADEMETYLRWVSETASEHPTNCVEALKGIARCSTRVEHEHLFTNQTNKIVTQAGLDSLWYDSFFPPDVRVQGDHRRLTGKAFMDSLSILRIASTNNFAYKATLVNEKSGRQTDFALAPDDSVSLLVRPGNYLLIAESTVMFKSGQIWRSPKNVLRITTPTRSSFRRCVIKTRVKREGE